MSASLVDAGCMAGLALVSVGLWTLRVALTARGRRMVGASLAALDALVFAVVFGNLVSDIDRPAKLVGYALGVAVGTLLGLTVDRRLAHGRSELRVVVEGQDARLVARLRDRGWPATALAADGLHGPATMVFVAVADGCLPRLVGDVRSLAPGAFWTVEPIVDASPVAPDDRYRELRSASAEPRVAPASLQAAR